MAFVSDEFIEEVRSRNDVVDVVGSYVRLTRKGANYFGLCPFHGEKTASFSVSPRKQMYYCFGCGKGGNVITFIKDYENMTFPEAVKLLADRAGLEMPEGDISPENRRAAERRSRLLEVNKAAASYFYGQMKTPNGSLGLQYFKKRGLSDETITKFALGYSLQTSDDLYRYLRSKGYEEKDIIDAGLALVDERHGPHDRFWNRVMFPILDANNHVIGFGGRVMGDGEPKYLNTSDTPVFDKSRNLYGLYLARKTKRPYIILCEGYMDVIALHQAGFDCAVATMGTSLTQGHARLLKRYTDNVLLCFDSDGAGIKATLRASAIVREAGLSAKVIRMNGSVDPSDKEHWCKDPDEFFHRYGVEAFEERIREAQNDILFKMTVERKSYDFSDPASETRFQKYLADTLLEFEEELERDNYIRAAAREFGISYDLLRQKVNEAGSKLRGGLAESKPRETHQSPELRARKQKEDGKSRSQRLLLTWLVEDDKIYQSVRPYIRPEDFEGELFQKVAGIIYQQLDSGEANPARILDMFAEEEEQQLVAAMFNGEVDEELSDDEKAKALKETILRLKRNNIERLLAREKQGDLSATMEIIEARKALDQLEKLPISYG